MTLVAMPCRAEMEWLHTSDMEFIGRPAGGGTPVEKGAAENRGERERLGGGSPAARSTGEPWGRLDSGRLLRGRRVEPTRLLVGALAGSICRAAASSVASA
jgi:hypothetical protein